jgi:hypothetical protein
MEVSDGLVPGPCSPEERDPYTPRTGGWVVARVDLDTVEKKYPCRESNTDSSVAQLVAKPLLSVSCPGIYYPHILA